MIRRRPPGRDQGSFTAEFAVGLPALMLLLFTGLTAVSAVTAKGQCVDAAREAALAAARGDPVPDRFAPPGSSVQVEVDGDEVRAQVRAPIRLLGAHLPTITVEGTAVAAREPTAISP